MRRVRAPYHERISMYEEQKKDIQKAIRLLRNGISTCDENTLLDTLLLKSFLIGARDVLYDIEKSIPRKVFEEEFKWLQKVDDELLELAERFAKSCSCSYKGRLKEWKPSKK